MFGKGKKAATITKKQEENIISTICGSTTSFQKTVSAEWVALASDIHSVWKVEEIVKKYGGKTVNGEVKLDSLRNAGKMGNAYAEIRRNWEKQMQESLRQKGVKKAAKKK